MAKKEPISLAMNTRVLFVCMGNICRSPMAEGVFRHLVRQAGLDDIVKVASAGAIAALAQLIECPLPQLSRLVVGVHCGVEQGLGGIGVRVGKPVNMWECNNLI